MVRTMPTAVFMPDLSFNRHARMRVERIGHEQQPLLIIDDALSVPDGMVEVARRVPFRPPVRGLYPGLTASLPPIYFRDLLAGVRPVLSEVFGIAPDVTLQAHGFFALATQGADELLPMQKTPHQDSADPRRLGMVHYLCRGRQGGTGFYRHRATGFESVGAERQAVFAPQAVAELKAGGDMAYYERTGFAEAVFNRLIVYRANMLHAGLLADSVLTDDPDTGRLTANSFVGDGPPD